MAKPKRWLTAAKRTAAETGAIKMPWTRGARRAAFIARRPSAPGPETRQARA